MTCIGYLRQCQSLSLSMPGEAKCTSVAYRFLYHGTPKKCAYHNLSLVVQTILSMSMRWFMASFLVVGPRRGYGHFSYMFGSNLYVGS